MPPFLVVGAGPSGLGCAWELARHGDVVVVDRIPVTGGSAGWSSRTVRRLTDLVTSRGALLRLGETAMRFDSDTLTVATPSGFHQIACRQLVFAGGLRPATAANLCIDGDRPAGVYAATVAEHLLRTGVKLWRTAVILGDGPWSQPVATMCHRLGTRVIAIAARAPWADERIDPAPHLSVVGHQRITSVRLRRSGQDLTISCDALVLASDPRPNRNVTGALADGDDNVVFHQPVRPVGAEDRFQAGSAAMRAWLQTSGGYS
jgi:glycine/D-amino acid oxidase-like deaminating enzyme